MSHYETPAGQTREIAARWRALAAGWEAHSGAMADRSRNDLAIASAGRAADYLHAADKLEAIGALPLFRRLRGLPAVSPCTLRRFRELRSSHPDVAASIVLGWARTPKVSVAWEYDANGRVVLARDGFDVVITVEQDPEGDLSWLGGWSRDDGWCRASGETEWFVPEQGYGDHRVSLSLMGYSRGVADALARQYVRQDYNRLRSGEPVYVIDAKVSRNGVTLGRASIGGYDFGTDGPSLDWADDCGCAADLVSEAIEDARATLAGLCAVAP